MIKKLDHVSIMVRDIEKAIELFDILLAKYEDAGEDAKSLPQGPFILARTVKSRISPEESKEKKFFSWL